MSFIIKTEAKLNGVPTDGLLCVAYAESRFTGVPAVGSPVPDTNPADAGPVASSATFGGTGEVQLAVPDASNYYIGCYQASAPWLIAWEGPKMATPHTSLQAVAATVAYGAGRGLAPSVTVASGSNGAVLPQSTIDVSTTTGIPTSGFAAIFSLGVISTIIQYTSVTGGGTPSLNGCTGGTGTLATGQFALAPVYQNGTRRRLIFITAELVVGAVNSAVSELVGYSTAAGTFQPLASAEIKTSLSGTAVAQTALIP